MTVFDGAFWEKHWAQGANAHRSRVAERPPDPHLVEVLHDLRPGLALDAGCGDGRNAIWLAAQSWQLTAVDIAASALAIGRAMAAEVGADVAERIDWVEADLELWRPAPGRFDLVSCLYVHTPGDVEQLVHRLAAGVAAGGTLLFAGHSPRDHSVRIDGNASRHRHMSVETIVAVLDPARWDILIAEERHVSQSGDRVDAVICARRHRDSS